MNEADIYREWSPPAAWQAAVACCWEQRVGAPRTQRVVPDGHADLVVFDDGAVEVVGLHDVVALPVLPAGAHVRGIRFRPAAVGRAFGVPACSLRNVTIAADAVLGARAVRALQAPDRLDAWLRSVEPDERARGAVALLGSRPVAEVADALGITTRHLRRVLLDHAGVGPKVLQRILRFQRFVRASDAGRALAAAAADAGYADQPHLSREVRALAGVAPSRLAAERRAS